MPLSRLINEEHFQFHTEFKTTAPAFTSISLNIEAKFDNYLLKYDEEDEALVFINKSTFTNQIAASDAKRDNIFQGLRDTVKAARNHYTPAKKAANTLMVIFDAHGNVAAKPMMKKPPPLQVWLSICRANLQPMLPWWELLHGLPNSRHLILVLN